MRHTTETQGQEPLRDYELMARARAVELAQIELWHRGLVSGELHPAVGEEAVAVGVVGALREGDAMALDHRGTAPLVARGADPAGLLLEAAGADEGLCGGEGGHMHLFAPELLAASDGIVGSSGPTACGFALAGRRLCPGSVAVAFFGEGAVNAGMMMESWNLAATWRLPVVFVCKDNGWSITTHSKAVTAGHVSHRARAFGLHTKVVDGADVRAVRSAAAALVARARVGRGPGLLVARVHRPHGHFMGDAMLRVLQEPIDQVRELGPGLSRSVLAPGGAPAPRRVTALAQLGSRFARLLWQQGVNTRHDPVARFRGRIDPDDAAVVDRRVAAEMAEVLARVHAALDHGPGAGAAAAARALP